MSPRYPIHITSRIRDDVPRLRNRERCKVIRRALLAVMDATDFRIREFSVQGNHLQLICEADSNAALAKGIKRFKLRVARGLNRQLGGRKGFTGWSHERSKRGLAPPDEPCVSGARSWLVKQGWRRHGLIGPTEMPPAGRE